MSEWICIAGLVAVVIGCACAGVLIYLAATAPVIDFEEQDDNGEPK